ncbi:hypothetical protein COLO4_19593 [Corchorus olitorius]|uniref:Uncharacterized protein n=1 Tax=Corchorus olitorius TaxID=93759 RepID=A0A1R3J4M7_9ROSI|nr:hypothetical protein COLO4_19593 [Corchorus olitorius]
MNYSIRGLAFKEGTSVGPKVGAKKKITPSNRPGLYVNKMQQKGRCVVIAGEKNDDSCVATQKVLNSIEVQGTDVMIFGRNQGHGAQHDLVGSQGGGDVVHSAWDKGDGVLCKSISEVIKEVKVWKGEVFGCIQKRKRILLARIRGIQNCLNADDVWTTDQSALGVHVVTYFSDLFARKACFPLSAAYDRFCPLLNSEEIDRLNALLCLEEVRRAVFSMQGLKAPGVDGIQPIFYQRQWEVVKDTVFRRRIGSVQFGGGFKNRSRSFGTGNAITKMDALKAAEDAAGDDEAALAAIDKYQIWINVAGGSRGRVYGLGVLAQLGPRATVSPQFSTTQELKNTVQQLQQQLADRDAQIAKRDAEQVEANHINDLFRESLIASLTQAGINLDLSALSSMRQTSGQSTRDQVQDPVNSSDQNV